MTVLAYPDTHHIALPLVGTMSSTNLPSIDLGKKASELEVRAQGILLIHSDGRVKHLLVDIELDMDGIWIASSRKFDVYGVGDSEQEALSDYKVMLLDYYQDLLQDEAILGPHLDDELQRLKSLIG